MTERIYVTEHFKEKISNYTIRQQSFFLFARVCAALLRWHGKVVAELRCVKPSEWVEKHIFARHLFNF